MRQVTVHATISAPREDIFDVVADLSLRPAWSDDFHADFRLARANPVGLGAAARFRLKGEWAGLTITQCDRPRRIVEEGGIGRLGRSKLVSVYDFLPEPGGGTRVELSTFSEPKTRLDAFKQSGTHRWVARRSRKALDRLRRIFEEPREGELPRASIAGYEPEKAARFGAHPSSVATAPSADHG